MPNRALIVIDVQNDYIGGNLPIAHPATEVSLPNIGRAIDAARIAGIPVIVVQNVAPEGSPFMAKGTTGAELHEVVTSRPRDHYFLKNLPSCFANTDLDVWLRQHGVDTLTVVGYMTHNCDFSTIVDAVHRGFNCEFLSDASGSLPYANSAGAASAEEIHRVMTVVMQARFATVMTTEQWLSAISGGETPARDNIYASNRRGRGLS